jgi:hypothetical protein
MPTPITAEVGHRSKRSMNFTPRPSIVKSTFLTFQPPSAVVRCGRRKGRPHLTTVTTAEVGRGSKPRKRVRLGCDIPFAVYRADVRKTFDVV